MYTKTAFEQGRIQGGGPGVQFEILRNPGIDFYSGSRDPKKSRYRLLQWLQKKNPGIHFYSGFREKKTQGGGAIRNPKTSSIDFYSGFRKTSQGGGANLIPKKVGPPYPQILDPPLLSDPPGLLIEIRYITIFFQFNCRINNY